MILRVRTGIRSVSDALPRFLPRGGELPDDDWRKRHQGFVFLLWAHTVGLPLFAIARGYGIGHALLEGGFLAIPALVASYSRNRMLAALAATFGLFSASGILVHFSGGTIEAHFHFFVMVTLISLYEAWPPYLFAIGYVVLHHATVGIFAPDSVYNHAAAINDPVTWAGIHGLFVLAASVAGLVVWRRNEDMRAQISERLDEQLRLNKTLDEFSGRVAHDLKGPLTAIAGSAGLLTRPELSDAQKAEFAEAIKRQTLKANVLVEGLLQLARASGTPTPRTIKLRELVEHAAEDLDSLRLEIDRLPAKIEADPIALEQAFRNLLQNAVRYARDESGTARVTISGDETDEGWRLVVADRGPGLDPDDAAGIFEPFRRGKQTAQDGTGLGLAIVRAAIEAHGGRAWYRRGEGRGSQFCIWLPKPVQSVA